MGSSWDEMLAEFRSLGGKAENVRLAVGQLGRGLFPIDPAKPIYLHAPESLLLEAKYAHLENGMFRVTTDAPIDARHRAFLENYQRDFSWGIGQQHVKELLQLVENAPQELRAFLDETLGVSTWLAGSAPSAVAERYFSSRVYGAYKGKRVIMPVIELVNHGPGARYDDTMGIGISGTFAGEVLVRYGDYDPFDLFANWGFASAGEGIAFSLNMRLDTPGGPLIIHQDAFPADPTAKVYVPRVSLRDGELTLSQVLLGHKQTPALPRSIFFQVMQNAGRKGPGVIFDMLQHINRSQFYRLLALSESADPQLGRLLREVARYQLEAMSCYIGMTPGAQGTPTAQIIRHGGLKLPLTTSTPHS
jgi:hypothetical protein